MAVLAGAASGALAATGVGLVGIVAGNTAISMAESAISQYFDKGNINTGEVIFDGAVGGIIGAVGGKGTGTKQLNDLGKQIVKRTLNKVEHQGLKAGLTEFKKASSYYAKSTIGYYKEHYAFKRNVGNLLWASGSGIITSDYMKGQYVHFIGRR